METDDMMDSSEFDYILELIFAVLFMIIGIFSLVISNRVLAEHVELTAQVDKTEVSGKYFENPENNPMVFSGYTTYMFGWLMDGVGDIDLVWSDGMEYPVDDTLGVHTLAAGNIKHYQMVANSADAWNTLDNGIHYGSWTNATNNKTYPHSILISPNDPTVTGFMSYRNRAITGALVDANNNWKCVARVLSGYSDKMSNGGTSNYDFYNNTPESKRDYQLWQFTNGDCSGGAIDRTYLFSRWELTLTTDYGYGLNHNYKAYRKEDHTWVLHPVIQP